MMPSRLGLILGMSIRLDEESCSLFIAGHPWLKVLPIENKNNLIVQIIYPCT
jgi:hypothetical protein